MTNQILQGVGTTGNFVLESQGTAAKDGFRNVSSLWYPKTHDFAFGLEQIEKGIQSRKDIETSLDAVTAVIDEQSRFAFAFEDGQEFVPNAHALRQFAVKLGIPITTVNHLTGEWSGDDGLGLLRNTFNVGLRRHNADQNTDDKDKFVFRTYNDNTLRAVLTDSFAPIDNRWFLELLSTLIPDGRLSHWKGDADEICGNILIPDSIRAESDSDYGGMVNIGNSEIGTGRISLMPSVFRAICQNGMIWNETKGNEVSQVHRGKIDLQVLAKKIGNNINEQIPLLAGMVDRVLALRSADFGLNGATVPQVYTAIAKQFNLTPKQARGSNEQFVKFESSERNLFGLLQGITRQSQEETNDQWIAMDKIAGQIAQWDSVSWANFTSRALTYKEVQITAALGLVAV